MQLIAILLVNSNINFKPTESQFGGDYLRKIHLSQKFAELRCIEIISVIRICPNLVSVGFMCIRDVQRFRIRGRPCESGRVYYKIKGLRPIVAAFFFRKTRKQFIAGQFQEV